MSERGEEMFSNQRQEIHRLLDLFHMLQPRRKMNEWPVVVDVVIHIQCLSNPYSNKSPMVLECR